MLPSSDFTILFSKSKDYLRCAFIIHLFAIILLLGSSLSLLITLPLSAFLIGWLKKITKNGKPLPEYHKITYYPGYWLLHKTDGHHTKFTHVSVRFEGGLFILLKLSGINSDKNIVIFNDQITTAEYRVLRLVSKRDREKKSAKSE